MYRTCPYCKRIISFRSILSPGPWKDEQIRCNRCDHIVSSYWKDFSLFFPIPDWYCRHVLRSLATFPLGNQYCNLCGVVSIGYVIGVLDRAVK